MFTGIIQTTGKIEKKDKASLVVSVSQETRKGRKSSKGDKKYAAKLKLGASVSVNGACLTVAEKTGTVFSADILPETWKRTMFKSFEAGSVVNIEFPVGEVPSFDGHIVQGHIDGTAILAKIDRKGEMRTLSFSAPKEIMQYVVPKGSIAVNGISLTVVAADKKGFSVSIIPHTWEVTNLKEVKIKDAVNIEVDILAKYAQKYAHKK